MDKKAVIFDFNGTLFWDSEINYIAWKRVIKRFLNRTYSLDEYFSLNGRTTKETLNILFKRDLLDEEIEYYTALKGNEYFNVIKEKGDDIKLAKGSIEFIENLKQNGICVAIATSATSKYIDQYEKYFNLLKYFDREYIVSNDGNYRSKPDPEIYNKTIEKLGVSPSNVVVFEDTKSGILSAYGANVKKVIAVKSPLCDTKSVENLKETAASINDFTNIDINELFK